MKVSSLISALALLASAAAAPITPDVEARDDVDVDKRIFYNPTTSGAYSALSAAQYSSWTSSARWAAAAYCGPTTLSTWTCGSACTNVLGSVNVLTAGGDNKDIPWYYVATNGSHIIVSIRGTNTASLASWANDIGFAFTAPSSSYYPGSPGKVHSGFYGAFQDLRADVLAAVNRGVAGGYTQVLVVGHSLGAAIANLASVYLQKQLGSSATVYARMFAPPRVGNPDWADYTDATLGARSQWMAVADDLVPHLPTLALNFRHSSNEVWMPSTSAPAVWRTCTGQENEKCSDSVSDNSAAKISSAHSGPFAGVTMAC